jgi:Fe2+ transport system protein B
VKIEWAGDRQAMATGLDKKYESILSKELSLAKAVAVAVIKTKPLTVWEVMIPIIFILNFVKLKESREIFVQNLLFTKKLALEAALDMIKKGDSMEEEMSRIKKKTIDLLTSVKNGIYSEEIRGKQLEEIELLIGHYGKLLKAEGGDYPSLVLSAYKTQMGYTTFLEHLKEAERGVTSAAQETLGSQANSEIISKIEEVSDRVRKHEAEKIFSKTETDSNRHVSK